MTKQEKLQREKKAEERSKMFDDWSEEEDEAEAEEKKQIKDIIKQKGSDSSDSGSEDENEPAFLDDDNINGNDDDDDDEILPPEPLNSKSSAPQESKDKVSETSELKDKLNVNKALQGKSGNDVIDNVLDIDKMLEETEVPKLKIDASSNNSPKKPKRGVKFSDELSKDIAIKKIQLVQTPSNLADPMEVDDEFAFSEEPELAVAKPILKRPNRPPPKIIQEPVNLDEESNLITGSINSKNQGHVKPLNNSSPDKSKKHEPKEPMYGNISSTLQSKACETTESTISDKCSENLETQANKSETDGKHISSSTESSSVEHNVNLTRDTKFTTAISEGESSETSTLQLGNNHESKKEEHELHAGQQALSTTEENAESVTNTGQGNDQEETYILLVDDNSDNVVDSLNSQLLYLDSNSLANGNVVLMTQDSVNAATQQGNGNGHTVAGIPQNNAVANGGTVLSIPPGGMQSLERQVVTTVDTKGGVATIPGQIQHSSAASQIQLITSPAQAPGPLVSATAKPTTIQSTE
jgi:hypothetical protein